MQSLIAANGHEAKQTNPSSPAPGPKSVQEPSVSAPEVSETETVNPSPVPSPEEATCGSAPGREVGVGTDKEKAQNEPLSKKKAAEWARIEDLDSSPPTATRPNKPTLHRRRHANKPSQNQLINAVPISRPKTSLPPMATRPKQSTRHAHRIKTHKRCR